MIYDVVFHPPSTPILTYKLVWCGGGGGKQLLCSGPRILRIKEAKLESSKWIMNTGNWKSSVIADEEAEFILTSGYRNLEICSL